MANRAAGNSPTVSHIRHTENVAKIMPKAMASFLRTRPAATGRPRVRRIKASVCPSIAMFRAPEAPAARAMHKMATNPKIGLMAVGEQTMPVKAVNTTKDMTRGFKSSK